MSDHTQSKHTLTALMENQPGVLNRVVSMFRRRGFNLDSLAVGRTERNDISRLTLVLEGSETDARRVEAELLKLIQVIAVERLDGRPHLVRDLALVRVAASSRTRLELLQLCDVFRARAVDVATGSMVVELTGDEEKVEGFIELLRPYGILELARTGVVAMARAEPSRHDTVSLPVLTGFPVARAAWGATNPIPCTDPPPPSTPTPQPPRRVAGVV